MGAIARIGDHQRHRRTARIEFDVARFSEEFARNHGQGLWGWDHGA